jgi:hypothetical protein
MEKWVDCPICHEDGMHCKVEDDFTYIQCNNGSCPSNTIGWEGSREEQTGKNLMQLAKAHGWKDDGGEGVWEFLSRKTYETAEENTNDHIATMLGWDDAGTSKAFLGQYFAARSKTSFFKEEAEAVRKLLQTEDWYAKADTPECTDLKNRCMRLVSCTEFGDILSKF